MAASTTKRGPLRFFFSFFSQTWVYIQLHPTRGGNCGNLCTQLFTAQLRGFLWTQVGQMLVASWCRKCSQGSKMKQFLSMSLSVLLFGVQESTVRSKFIIYIYIFGCEVIWRCGNNAGLLLWKQNHVELYPAIIPFHAFYNVEVVRS